MFKRKFRMFSTDPNRNTNVTAIPLQSGYYLDSATVCTANVMTHSDKRSLTENVVTVFPAL